MNSDCFVFVEERDEFRMWQGLVGPYYTPAVDSLGNLSWTNNGNLVNPPTVNVSGRGLTITGIVDTSGDLPSSAPQYTVYLVGATSPYHGYIFDGTSWVDLGVIGKGDTGDPGADGFSPVVTVTTITGGHEVSIEDANGTQTFDVMDGQDGAPGEGVPSGGTDGQMLVKDGSTDYATKWQNQPTIPSAYTSNPAMDGTASPGSSTAWAKGDHVHPHDTSKADTGLGITGATVGKVPVISAVDGNGVPTAFVAGDGGDVTADMLGIVIDGNSTPVGASKGQYVIVKNSTISGVTDGLYKAALAIPANTAIDATYLTAVSGGGLNDVTKVEDVSINIDTTKYGLASWGNVQGTLVGSLLFIRLQGFNCTNDLPSLTTIITLNGYKANASITEVIHTGQIFNGTISVDKNSSAIKTNGMISGRNSYAQLIIPVSAT